jgi:hypothetical protein
VVEWFQGTNKFLTNFYGQTIPSLAFYHIPVQAMAAFQTEGVNAYKEPGINDDNPLAQQGLVYTSDGGSYYDGADIPFIQALVNTPGLMATFSGHDHGDDWCVSILISVSLPTKLIFCIGASNGTAFYRI